MTTIVRAYPPMLEEKALVFMQNAQIVLGIGGGSVSADKTRTLTWDSKYTTVSAARLYIRAHTDWSPSDYIIRFNGDPVYRKDFTSGWAEDDTANVDVTSLILSGANTLTTTFERPLGGATLTYSVTLYYTFEGEPPAEAPGWLDQLMQYLKNPYVLAGVGLATVGVIVLATKRRTPQVVYVSPQPAARYRRARNRRR